jgi:hypothetical protein
MNERRSVAETIRRQVDRAHAVSMDPTSDSIEQTNEPVLRSPRGKRFVLDFEASNAPSCRFRHFHIDLRGWLATEIMAPLGLLTGNQDDITLGDNKMVSCRY